MTLEQFISGFFGASAVEIIASVAGFICVYLVIKRNIWCWFFGFIQVSLFAWLFFQTKLYSDAGLHVIYVGLQIYGWQNWIRHKKSVAQGADIVIHTTTKYEILLWMSIALFCTGLLGTLMHLYTDASFAYADAFTTCTSLVAQWLLTRRHLLNWLFWIIVDIVAIFIYYQKGLYPTSVLYFTFLVMCFFGQYSWFKQHQQQAIASAI